MSQATIEPFFFGPPSARLFGCYEPPASPSRSDAVLICPPIGPEYFTAHRGLRQLASRLVVRGFPVLRFDYFGIGDSAGDFAASSLGQLKQDLAVALAELRARSSRSCVTIVGHRLGASVVLATDLSRESLGGVVLWDPVVSGKSFLTELGIDDGGPTSTGGRDGVIEQNGFEWSRFFCDELMTLDLSAPSAHIAARMLVIETSSTGPGRALAEAHRSRGVEVDYVLSEMPRPDADSVERITVPAKVIQEIVRWTVGASS